jgi:copper chaperone NosL
MTISNSQYAAQLITDKGRIYKFDDFSCMIQYAKENSALPNRLFVNDYVTPNKFISVEQAFFLKGGTIHGPMGGKAIAFSTQAGANSYKAKMSASQTSWSALYNPK